MNKEDILKEKRTNFKERIWFIKYWVDFMKNHSDKEWSEQQAVLIDAQYKSQQI